MRLAQRHKRWVYWSVAMLFASGALWLLFHYFVRVHGEFGETPHPLEVWWLRLHGAAAMLVLIVVGSLLPVHIRVGWHQRRNLAAGVPLLALALLLALTGYALYYFGGEESRGWISVIHWAAGLVAGGVLVWHVIAGHADAARRNPMAVRGEPSKRVAGQ